MGTKPVNFQIPLPEAPQPVDYKAPAEDLSQPTPYPQQAGWVGKGGAVAGIAANVLHGWLAGQNYAAQQKQQKALNTVKLQRESFEMSRQSYQERLQAGEDPKSEEMQKLANIAVQQYGEYATTMVSMTEPPQDGKKGKGQKLKEGMKKGFAPGMQDPILYRGLAAQGMMQTYQHAQGDPSIILGSQLTPAERQERQVKADIENNEKIRQARMRGIINDLAVAYGGEDKIPIGVKERVIEETGGMKATPSGVRKLDASTDASGKRTITYLDENNSVQRYSEPGKFVPPGGFTVTAMGNPRKGEDPKKFYKYRAYPDGSESEHKETAPPTSDATHYGITYRWIADGEGNMYMVPETTYRGVVSGDQPLPDPISQHAPEGGDKAGPMSTAPGKVRMKAPNGDERDVDQKDVKHYEGMGAKKVEQKEPSGPHAVPAPPGFPAGTKAFHLGKKYPAKERAEMNDALVKNLSQDPLAQFTQGVKYPYSFVRPGVGGKAWTLHAPDRRFFADQGTFNAAWTQYKQLMEKYKKLAVESVGGDEKVAQDIYPQLYITTMSPPPGQ